MNTRVGMSKSLRGKPGGSGTPPKKFEPQREHGSKFFGGRPDPPGYDPDPEEGVV